MQLLSIEFKFCAFTIQQMILLFYLEHTKQSTIWIDPSGSYNLIGVMHTLSLNNNRQQYIIQHQVDSEGFRHKRGLRRETTQAGLGREGRQGQIMAGLSMLRNTDFIL